MSCGNPFNHLQKNIKGSFLNHELFSTSKPSKFKGEGRRCFFFNNATSLGEESLGFATLIGLNTETPSFSLRSKVFYDPPSF